jgi:hypothetical protein
VVVVAGTVEVAGTVVVVVVVAGTVEVEVEVDVVVDVAARSGSWVTWGGGPGGGVDASASALHEATIIAAASAATPDRRTKSIMGSILSQTSGRRIWESPSPRGTDDTAGHLEFAADIGTPRIRATGRRAHDRRMTRISRTRLIALALLPGLLASTLIVGGSTTSAGTPSPTTVPAPPTTTVALDPAAVAGSLEAAGIAVADESDATGKIAVTRHQLDAMAAEVADGNGVLGADLDAITPMPAGAPPFSYLVAAWMHVAPTPRAELARSWYPADTDWAQAPRLALPRAVLLLFVIDVAEDADANLPALPADQTFTDSGGSTPDTTPSGWRTESAVGAACSLVHDFFTNQITVLFNKLKLGTDFLGGGALGFAGGIIATIWNAAVDLARTVVQGLVDTLGRPVLEAIGKAIAVTGLVTHISSYVTGWRIDVSVDSSTLWMSGQPGVFTISDTTEQFSWRPALEQCATAFGIRLPAVLAPGTEVRWQVVENAGLDGYAPLIVEQSSDTVIPQSGQPTFRFVTGTDPFPGSDKVVFGRATVVARVANSDLRRVLDLTKQLIGDAIGGIVTGALPPVPGLADEVRGALQQIYNPALEQLDAAITSGSSSVFELTAQDAVYVYYHGEDDDPPPPPPPPPAPPAPGQPGPGQGSGGDAFCAVIRAWPGPSSGDIAGSGNEGLALVDDLTPVTPPEMVDEVDALEAMYAASAAMDFATIATAATPFGEAWQRIFDYCGIAT